MVEYPDLSTEEVTARGVLRIRSSGILTGDYVEVKNGVIAGVLPAKTKFVRPALSNVDVLCLVLAMPPEPDFLLADKVLVASQVAGTETVIVVNKSDLSDDIYRRVMEEYRAAGVTIIRVSAVSGEGIEQLKNAIRGKLCAFCGQSAVGKTSLLNALFGLNRKTGEVSDKTLRGRHTTTACEIVRNGEFRIADTPGFSSFWCEVDADTLAGSYEEFSMATDCRFRGCRHLSEPDCAVKQAVDRGEIAKQRYLRYVELQSQLEGGKKKYEK